MTVTDQATEVRSGEALDPETIESFLHDALPGLTGDLKVHQFPRGHSNLTYLVTVGQREFVLRRPPFGTKAATAHDMGREYRVLSALDGVYPYSPKPIAFCEDAGVIGAPFYVMEPIRGIIVRRKFPEALNLSAGDVTRIFRRLVEALVELHTIDYRRIGLGDFGKPEGYVERQVLGWSKRYRAARTPDAAESEDVMQWLAAHMPAESARPGIIHNDFKLDNVVLDPRDPRKIIGVLDWEMATVGDPLMDLGATLGYWVQPDDPEEMQAIRFIPTHAEGALTREQVVACYTELSGIPVDNFGFYLVFGTFRLAVIAQQIYYRYYHGQTRDQRFALFIHAVNILDRTARRHIERLGG